MRCVDARPRYAAFDRRPSMGTEQADRQADRLFACALTRAWPRHNGMAAVTRRDQADLGVTHACSESTSGSRVSSGEMPTALLLHRESHRSIAVDRFRKRQGRWCEVEPAVQGAEQGGIAARGRCERERDRSGTGASRFL
jgi:hypothetical protein